MTIIVYIYIYNGKLGMRVPCGVWKGAFVRARSGIESSRVTFLSCHGTSRNTRFDSVNLTNDEFAHMSL